MGLVFVLFLGEIDLLVGVVGGVFVGVMVIFINDKGWLWLVLVLVVVVIGLVIGMVIGLLVVCFGILLFVVIFVFFFGI